MVQSPDRLATSWTCACALVGALVLASVGCMTRPRHGELLPGMSGPVFVQAFAGVGETITLQHAVFKKDTSGYAVVGWQPFGSCVTAYVDTDVTGLAWGGCQTSLTLPASDATFGGTGVWHGTFSAPFDGRRYANVRGNNGALVVFSSGVSDQVLYDAYEAVGGREVMNQYGVGLQAEVQVATPKLGIVDMAGVHDATDVVVRNGYAYVTRIAAPRFVVVDVTPPTTPVVVASLTLDGQVMQLAVEGPYAYLATTDNSKELIIIDVTDPAAPQVKGQIDIDGVQNANTVAAVGDMVYVGRDKRAGGPEFFVLQHDFANPGAVTELGTFEVSADVRDVVVTDDRAYLATNSATAHFRVLDVANPSAIVTLGTYQLGSGFAPKALDYFRGYVYGVVDTANTANFVVLSAPPSGSLSLSATLNLASANTGVYVYGGRAFLSTADPARGLTVIDVTQPATPAFLAYWATAGGAAAVTAHDGVIHVAASDNAAELQLFSVPLEPVLRDVTNDNLVTIACLGDSNSTPTSWCEMVEDSFTDPTWQTVNVAVVTAMVAPLGAWGCCNETCTGGFPCANWPDSYEQMQNPAVDDADAIVIAPGFVDAVAAGCNAPEYPYYRDLEPTIQTLLAHEATLAAYGGIAFLTIPAPCGEGSEWLPCDSIPERNNWILRLGNRIRHELPRERILDFNTLMIGHPEYLLSDGIHINAAGQAARAAEALSRLQNP